MLLLLKGSKSLQRDIFIGEWRLLTRQINAHGFGMRCLTIIYECNVVVGFTHFWPHSVDAQMLDSINLVSKKIVLVGSVYLLKYDFPVPRQ